MFDGMEMRHQGPCLENAKQLGMKHAQAIYIYMADGVVVGCFQKF